MDGQVICRVPWRVSGWVGGCFGVWVGGLVCGWVGWCVGGWLVTGVVGAVPYLNAGGRGGGQDALLSAHQPVLAVLVVLSRHFLPVPLLQPIHKLVVLDQRHPAMRLPRSQGKKNTPPKLVSWLSWGFEPSQPLRIISGLGKLSQRYTCI